MGQRTAHEAAREVLAAAMAGKEVSDPALLLAESVLGGRVYRLAREVAEGGAHAVRAAIELAGIILAADLEQGSSEGNGVMDGRGLSLGE